ncbi:ERC protein 2 [Schistosoma japonicum]|nr:ERC protein 2 [Schistosoma japonicum]KAH8876378.1 ERC protein 2 [Schistosoma japonicum]KAH8876381.1 ERC protein 2 [Schistosoma japonicum]
MESGRHRSPYYRDNLNLSSHQYVEGVDSNPDIHDRQRPASVQDLEYGEMYDSGIQPHSTTPRLNNPYVDPLIEGDVRGIDHRAASLDRRGEYYGTLRGNFDSQSERLTRKSINRPSYTLESLSSNPGLSGALGLTNPTSGRRAHSYDMNLEKQGLTDYNSLLAAAGVATNSQIYGYPTNPLLDYSSNLGIQTFPTIGGLDYATLQRSGVYPALPQTQQPSIPVGLISHNPTTDITTLQRECVRLQHELHITREKLNACTISIRTFWSPELKRERAMRKEENAKYAILADHLHQLQLEKQTMLETLHNMESDLRQERDKRNRSRFSGMNDSDGMSELDLAKRQVDELTLENHQLKKSIEDADRRSANLKSSLNATEDSLRRLVDAVKAGKSSSVNVETTTATNLTTGDGSKSIGGGDQSSISTIKLDRIEADRAEISRLRNQLNEVSSRKSEVERQLIERNFELSRIKEDFDALLQEHRQLRQECESLRHDTRQTQTLQSLVDTKESKILTLENEIRLLEDEITRLRDDGLTTPNTSTSSGIDDLDKTLQVFRSNERILKSKIEMLNSEISKRECELYTLQSRLEMVDKQQQDQNHHINVLKEQVNTREHKISMLTADAEDFRKRIKEKESLLEKKSKALNTAQSAKRQTEQELTELKDQMDMKDRKISLLQRKIENVEDLLNDKETQLAAAQARLSRISTERVSSDGSRIGWEETLKDKDRQIERLKEARQRSESEIAEELETQKRLNTEFKNRLDILQKELDEKTTQLLEVRDETSDYRTSRFRLETEISQLQTQLSQKNSEVTTLQMEKQLLQKQITTESDMKFMQRTAELEGQLNHYMETSSKLQAEVDRLLRTIDTEKFDKENQLHELKEELRETQTNLNNLKRNQQTERKKSNQQIEELRQREENAMSDNEILKGIITDKDGRIRELEQALRESVRLTAEREIYASGRDDETRHLEQQVRELRNNLEHFQRERNNLSAQLASAQEELSDRENQLKTLEQECFQNYLPELEKLRRSNHEANLRVAAMIKLTQGREHTLTDQDRAALSTIPLFPNISLHGAWSGLSGGLENIGTASGTGRSGYLAPYHTGSGGSLSPHLAGSAFQFIGNTSSGVVGGRASVPGQPMASPDVIMLTKMLQEKENMLQQHLQELTRLRFQNSELEIRLKATQRELDTKATRLNVLETAHLSSTTGLHDIDTRSASNNQLSKELAVLRKTNQELSVKFNQLQMELDERSRSGTSINVGGYDRLKSSVGLHTTDFTEMATLRRELASAKAEREVEVASLNSQMELIKRERDDFNEKLNETKSDLTEKISQLRSLEAEKDKLVLEKDALQKKYESVLNQLSEKSEKLKQTEQDCAKSHIEEIKRQKADLDDLKHHIGYLQNTIKERETRIESIEKESFKLRDELTNMRKQLATAEAEVKSLRDDAVYREERIKQMQAQYTEELARLRCTSQEQVTRIGHLEMKLDEKGHQLKSQTSEIRCQADEITRLQSTIEETNNRLTVNQKRAEERETRLRKLENENHDLLDEIHGLRKGNTELESQIDSLRQRLLDRQESTDPISALSSGLPLTTRMYQPSLGISTTSNQELDRLRKQHSEMKTTCEQTQKSLEEVQIQYDQMKIQYDNLQLQMEHEVEKRKKLEELLNNKADELKGQISVLNSTTQPTQHLTLKIEELRKELERKEAQIICLNKQIDRQYTSSSITPDTRQMDSTNQQLLIADLQVRLRQAIEDRDVAREQLATNLARTETSTLDVQQQYMMDKQNLQQQITNLTQTMQNATNESERYQREFKQASSRVQQLSRQLQETQSNCDSIARQRDSLRDQLDQLKRSMGRSGSGTMSSIFGITSSAGGMRPASAGPGSYDSVPVYGSTAGTAHLSREMDRLHRECEHLQNQLKISQESEQEARILVDSLQNDIKSHANDVEKLKEQINELEKQKVERDNELTKTQRELQVQADETKDKLTNTQQLLIEKTNQLENAVNQLNNVRQYCSELELRVNEMSQRLNMAESHTQLQADELKRFHQLEIECNQLRNEIKAKVGEVQHLQLQLDQLNREYQNQERRIEQMTIELSTAQANTNQMKQEIQQFKERNKELEIQLTNTSQTIKESETETLNILRAELKDSQLIKQRLQDQLNTLEVDLSSTRQELDEKARTLEILENTQLRKQSEEIASLQKELTNARIQIEELGGPIEPGSKSRGSPLKVEIDALKREISKRDDILSRIEKECQEKHLHRIEVMQSQLRRFEEETANLNQVLDEQRVGLEERDLVIRQLRSDQAQGSLIELEKLKVEHSSCKDKIEQLNKRITTLNKQVEDQSDEILTIKLESLTASLCEKEANIALMELTAPKNAASNQALEKLRAERDQLQQQQKQLSNTRAMLLEEKMSRR